MLEEQTSRVISFMQMAEEYYSAYCPHIDFHDDLFFYCENGYFLTSPHFLLMAKAVPRRSSEKDIMASYIKFDIEKCNTLYINLFIGDLYHAISIIPKKFKYVCYQRCGKGPLRYFNVKRIQTKV